MITRRLFLFVGVFVFFIHNDQAEILERRENGAARPNHNPRAARIYLLPFIMTFTFGQVAVQNRYRPRRFRETAFEALDGLRRQ